MAAVMTGIDPRKWHLIPHLQVVAGAGGEQLARLRVRAGRHREVGRLRAQAACRLHAVL